MTIHAKHKQWIEQRGITADLAEKFGLETVKRNGGWWLSVPYRENGETVNHKYRRTSEKRHMMDADAPLSLWNADCLSDPKVQSGQAPLVICEGEWDALAAIQAGFQYAVSVPNGAPAAQTEPNELATARRYDWMDRHAEALKGVGTFVIAADADQPGYNLSADIVGLLGAERCRFVEYPFPCKDLNDVLLEYGPERVVDCISTAKPYPVQGLYRLSDFPERKEVRAYSIGIEAIADLVAIVPGTLTIFTGYANAGKSTVVNQVLAHAMLEHFPVCVGSFETDVKPILRDALRCSMLRCAPAEMARHPKLADADDILEQRLSIISNAVDEEHEMDIDGYLDLCRVAVRRDGAKLFVLDPWNELEHKRRRDESETDYIGRALRAVKRFAKQYDVAFWIIAHPRTPHEGTKTIPGLYNISGSANWANKADYGLTYHRPRLEENRATIRITKVRMGLPGRRGDAEVTYDFRVSRFRKIEQGEM